jgi:hypothetical protein
MKKPRLKWMPLFCAAVAVAIFTIQPVQGAVLEKIAKVAGVTVLYKVVLCPTVMIRRRLIRLFSPSVEVRKP